MPYPSARTTMSAIGDGGDADADGFLAIAGVDGPTGQALAEALDQANDPHAVVHLYSFAGGWIISSP